MAQISETATQFLMESGEHTTHSPEETFELGERIGRYITHKAILLLTGELGSGKTVFTKGVAAGLDIDPIDVTSPSFTLVNIHQGRLRRYHVDLFRLESGNRIDLGLEEAFEEDDSVVIIEWGERLDCPPPTSTWINFQYTSGSERRIIINQVPS